MRMTKSLGGFHAILSDATAFGQNLSMFIPHPLVAVRHCRKVHRQLVECRPRYSATISSRSACRWHARTCRQYMALDPAHIRRIPDGIQQAQMEDQRRNAAGRKPMRAVPSGHRSSSSVKPVEEHGIARRFCTHAILANDRRAITAGYWFLRARCPRTVPPGAVDLRRLDWHRGAAVAALIPSLSCRSCRPNAPFAQTRLPVQLERSGYYAERSGDRWPTNKEGGPGLATRPPLTAASAIRAVRLTAAGGRYVRRRSRSKKFAAKSSACDGSNGNPRTEKTVLAVTSRLGPAQIKTMRAGHGGL